jgi:hypothetical protein
MHGRPGESFHQKTHAEDLEHEPGVQLIAISTNLPSETQSSTGLTREIDSLEIASGNANQYRFALL